MMRAEAESGDMRKGCSCATSSLLSRATGVLRKGESQSPVGGVATRRRLAAAYRGTLLPYCNQNAAADAAFRWCRATTGCAARPSRDWLPGRIRYGRSRPSRSPVPGDRREEVLGQVAPFADHSVVGDAVGVVPPGKRQQDLEPRPAFDERADRRVICWALRSSRLPHAGTATYSAGPRGPHRRQRGRSRPRP